jgi:ComF family protein
MQIRGVRTIKRLATELLDLLFPRLCNACGQYLVRGEDQICTYCLHDLPYTDYHLYADNRAAKQFWGRLPCDAVMAMLFFKKESRVQHLLHRLKYNGQRQLGIFLGKLLGERLIQSGRYSAVDFVIYVPLHKKRERHRGYNQAALIAEGIAEMLAIPVLRNVLIKTKATQSQTRKGRFSRYENLKSVFEVVDPEKIRGKHILLVDDVITTGATLEACGIVLHAAGIRKLSIAAIAFTE